MPNFDAILLKKKIGANQAIYQLPITFTFMFKNISSHYPFDTSSVTFVPTWRWVAKLVATAALWVRIQTSTGDKSKGMSNKFKPTKKYLKKAFVPSKN
jgi:hypothetical protein